MAASQGYQCDFIDSVFDDFYCKKCTQVARRLSIITCCMESFCHACIAITQEEGKPCPACGEEDYNILEHVKNQRRINNLQAYCSMKERGCGWSGSLEQLDTHLDPDQDNCQYVDTKCPLNCHMTIPRNKVEQHVAQDCAKRPYVCQYCSFKATYEEVVDAHIPVCKYVPLQCPNLCGVSCEREDMEDHMKMCRLEEIGCEFSGVGCDDRFRREDQEEHTRQDNQKHLTLTAFLVVETKEQLYQKLLEQDKNHKEEEEKLKKMIGDQEMKIDKQEKKMKDQLQQKLLEQDKKHKEEEEKLKKMIGDQETKIDEQEKKMKYQWGKLEEQKKKLEEQKEMFEQQFNLKLQELKQILVDVRTKSNQNETKLSELPNMTRLNRKFEMKNFSGERAKNQQFDWKSPVMYTHVYGYKFCIIVDANGFGSGLGKSVYVVAGSMSGNYDDVLKWPIKVKITVQLINQQGGENACHSETCTWKKPTSKYGGTFGFYRKWYGFLDHSELSCFLEDDTLYFFVSEVKLL